MRNNRRDHVSPRYHLGLLAVFALAAANPQLLNVHTVYLLPMTSGMDQYLANRLTDRGVLQVVSDPNRADAVLTDHLGQSFEETLNQLYAAPKKEADKGATFEAPPHPPSTFGRGQGAFFLVDRKTRSVLWSVYETPSSHRPGDMNRVADRIAKNLATTISKAGGKRENK